MNDEQPKPVDKQTTVPTSVSGPDDVPPTEPVKLGHGMTGRKVDVLDAERLGVVTSDVSTLEVTRKIEGTELVQEFTGLDGISSERFVYWIGLMPDAPVEAIVLAGQSWPKINKVRRPNPDRSGTDVFMPVIGHLARMDARQIALILDRMPWTVFRFRSDPGQKEEPGTGKNIGDVSQQPSRGHVITVKTPAQLALLRSMNQPAPEYFKNEGDQPAARYMFAVLCADQKNPARREFYPEVLEVSGLDWPGGDIPTLPPCPLPAVSQRLVAPA